MIGLGTLINGAAIVGGGLLGNFTGKLFQQDQQESLNKACGISVIFIAIAGAMQGMLSIDGGAIASGKSMLVVLCLAAGTIIGELIGIENGFERFGEWLKVKTGNSGDASFVNAFVTTSLTVCIGAMAIVGAIQDGILGDYSTLAVKSVLDFIIVAVMTSSMGKGCAFHNTARQADRTDYDGHGNSISFFDRLDPDLLCGRKPCLGQKSARREYAAGSAAGGAGRLSALELVMAVNAACQPRS